MNEIIKKGLEIIQSTAGFAISEGPKVLNEYLNIVIFNSLIDLIPSICCSLFLFLVVRLFNSSIIKHQYELEDINKQLTNNEDELKRRNCDEKKCGDKHCFVCDVIRPDISNYKLKKDDIRTFIETLKNLKLIFITVVGLYTISSTIPTIKVIGKICIAPRVFLLQEGVEMIKKSKEKL